MIGLNRKGSVLLYAVIAMTAISVLGTGIYFLTSTSTFSGLRANQQNRAYQLALAGKNYALTKNLGNTASLYPSGRDFTLSPFTSGNKFRLVVSDDTITSTGIVNENMPYEARKTITVTKTDFRRQAGLSGMTAMGIIQPTGATGAKGDFITKTDTSLSLGKIGDTTETDIPYRSRFGAVVYSGNAAQGNCVAGKCEFGSGFNAFFVFQINASALGADGFTFAFFNGDGVDVNGKSNNSQSVGGYLGWGELLGYAGNSYTGSGYLDGQGGRGIQPPKVAVEFDPYANSGTGSVCGSDSRYDASGTDVNHANHMALMFWGDNTGPCFPTTVGKNTFDDNRHPTVTDITNGSMNAISRPLQSGWNPCYYFNGDTQCTGAQGLPTNWLLTAPNNVYAFRMEVTRNPTAVGGNHSYQIKTWIQKCGSGDLACSAYGDSSTLANTKVSYTDTNPTLNRTIQLDEPNHQAFNTLLFGWTTATGSATQNVNINRFKMNFLK